jgi:predicted ester cyclase
MADMTEDIKSISRRFFEEIMPRCDVEALRAVVDPDIVDRPARPGERPGVDGAIDTMLWLARVFTDQRWEVHTVLADGDMVCVHTTHHARHVGTLMGVEPTGRTVAYDYAHFLRYRDGKAVEHWSVRDDMTLMRQLGVIPSREPSAAAAG